ncbi:UNKNOWN [Stylonychia lemnae]|uniref:Uncharacterized protein n=1 Tax=Stylonychia lemnae TaxID=5949 RepID=A0A077ZX39_STYLE|nr:UNKNOWN [Stylonychia lemnae]|eukprot:CDW74460.1 UNKNOWN [Stylonychia lemnae]
MGYIYSYSFERYRDDVLRRIGQGYGVGLLAGSVIFFFSGMYYAPIRQRIISGILNARDKAPALGGNFAGWCGCFAFFGDGMKYGRQIDDKWNDTIGGGATAFLLSLRSYGFQNALKQGLQIGLFFYFMEAFKYSAIEKKRQEVVDGVQVIKKNDEDYEIVMTPEQFAQVEKELLQKGIAIQKHGDSYLSFSVKKQ